jgi:hypothetical protein
MASVRLFRPSELPGSTQEWPFGVGASTSKRVTRVRRAQTYDPSLVSPGRAVCCCVSV